MKKRLEGTQRKYALLDGLNPDDLEPTSPVTVEGQFTWAELMTLKVVLEKQEIDKGNSIVKKVDTLFGECDRKVKEKEMEKCDTF